MADYRIVVTEVGLRLPCRLRLVPRGRHRAARSGYEDRRPEARTTGIQ